MFQIRENAGKLIRKMTQKNGFPDGGLRIGIKAGGCSGLSYVFAWEPAPRDGRSRVRRARRREGFRRPEELQVHRRHHARLRHEPRQQGIHVQQPEREEHVRVRDVIQRVAPASSFQLPDGHWNWLEAGNWTAGSFNMSTSTETIEELATREYKYGFVTDVESDTHSQGAERGRRPADLGRRRTSRSGCSSGG